MAKKMFFSVLLIVFCSISVFSYDKWDNVADWVDDNASDDSEVDGCTWSPDGIIYFGRYISFKAVCDQHDRDYSRKVDRAQADAKLRDGIYDTLRRNGVDVITALKVANLYYVGVRTVGWAFY